MPKTFDHKVTIKIPKLSYDDDQAHIPIENWIWDNIGWKEYDGDGNWTADLDDSQNPFVLSYYFRDEKDAVFFALRWGASLNDI